MIGRERIIELMKAERECVSRNSGRSCDRNCGACDLVQDDQELLAAFDGAIERLEKLRDAQAPIFRSGESVVFAVYADGTGGPKKHRWADWTCPACGWFVGEQYIPRRHNQRKSNYCSRCGQKIDWTAVEDRKCKTARPAFF